MIFPELPAGYVPATYDDFFTDQEIPTLKLGITYFKKQGDAYRSGVTSDNTIPRLLASDVKAGVIYVQKVI